MQRQSSDFTRIGTIPNYKSNYRSDYNPQIIIRRYNPFLFGKNKLIELLVIVIILVIIFIIIVIVAKNRTNNVSRT